MQLSRVLYLFDLGPHIHGRPNQEPPEVFSRRSSFWTLPNFSYPDFHARQKKSVPRVQIVSRCNQHSIVLVTSTVASLQRPYLRNFTASSIRSQWHQWNFKRYAKLDCWMRGEYRQPCCYPEEATLVFAVNWPEMFGSTSSRSPLMRLYAIDLKFMSVQRATQCS